ncbi:MAG: MBL fold metallo-hydrolase [Candidatus Omnitrophota bacterium]|jgi:7,8-dihydropterin-6-yl-methyl-4-(beta-D-ribofuranosyl)aminobenzene 5'-phosphate synthase
MKIKIIAVGSSKRERSIRRWGVSFLIGEDVLFDTFGDPKALLHNMRKFTVDRSKIKHIILSHDDWDHITGLWDLIPGREDITVYICPGFRRGIRKRIISSGAKLVEIRETARIKDGIYSTGRLCGESQGKKIYEQSVVIKTAGKLSVICGCAHPGVVNIVRHAQERFCGDFYSLIGGFHLKDNTAEANRRIIADLRELGVRRIAPMHCTGKSATEMMRKEFGRDFIQAGEGRDIEL